MWGCSEGTEHVEGNRKKCFSRIGNHWEGKITWTHLYKMCELVIKHSTLKWTYIHSSILSLLAQGFGGSGDYPRNVGCEMGTCHGWVASPSQDTHILYLHTRSHLWLNQHSQSTFWTHWLMIQARTLELEILFYCKRAKKQPHLVLFFLLLF